MAWIKLDDDFLDNRKFLRAGPLAGYLHIAAIAWSRHHLTDGVIPREQPARLAAWHVVDEQIGEEAVSWTKLVDVLVEEGLWHERKDGDYEIHDYLEHQDSAEKVEAERARKRDNMQGYRDRRGRDVATPQTGHSSAGGQEVAAHRHGHTSANGRGVATVESREERVEITTTVEADASTYVELRFDQWRERCGHPKAKLSPERRRAIERRLKEDPSDEEWRQAFEGAARGAFVGDNGHRHDDIELICRNRVKFDSFIARANAPASENQAATRGRRSAALKGLMGRTGST